MKLLFPICALLLSLSSLNAQVTDGRVTYDKSTFESLRLDIDADYKEVADEWEDFCKARYDVDFDKLDKDRGSIAMNAEQAIVPLVSSKNANLFSKVTGSDTRAEVALAVTFTENDVVTRSTHTESYDAAKAIMMEFRTYFYSQYFDDKLEEARDELNDMRDDSTDDSKDAQKARKKIEKYEEKIAKYERKIQDMREEVGDELESAEDKAQRARELESRVRELERMRAKYLG